MKKVIHIKDEDVHIVIPEEEDITGKYTICTKGAIAMCIKHVYRYKEFTMPKDIMIRILFSALRGVNCNEDHLDITQRDSIYEALVNVDTKDPYLLQFLKETKEMLHKGEELDVTI